MAVQAPCPPCESGDHTKHVDHWLKAPEGVLGGAYCPCQGDCKPPDLSGIFGVSPRATSQRPCALARRAGRVAEHYTDADVEAGLRALLGFDAHPSTHDAWAASVRRVLDAVAPAIAARALREAADADWPWPVSTDASPHRMHSWLTRRADEIETQR